MKKMVASIATGVMIAGATVTTVSAAEYTVEKGDSLWEIAQEYNTTVDELVGINELDHTTIHPGQTIFIHDSYQVQKGDTLTGISKEFDVAVDDLKNWNDLKSDIIVIGQELDIKGVDINQEDETASDDSSDETNEPVQTTANSNEDTNQNQSSQDSPDGKTISVTATAYSADCDGCSGVTSTGIDLNSNPDAKVIAVDPSVIPLGSEVYVEGYGYATAADVGGAISGEKIDVHVPSKEEANNWGVRTVDVTILNE